MALHLGVATLSYHLTVYDTTTVYSLLSWTNLQPCEAFEVGLAFTSVHILEDTTACSATTGYQSVES